MIEKELIEKVTSRILSKEKEGAFLTGFNNIDKILNYDDTGALIIIGGRPAMGKTTFMMNICEKVLNFHKSALFFNIELSNENFICKMINQMTEIDSIKFRKKEFTDIDIKKIQLAQEQLEKLPITIFDKKVLTLQEIEEQIRSQVPDYVFIDYLQLIDIGEENQSEKLEKTMLGLKNLTKEYKIPIFVNSQLSRAVENRRDKRPFLSDLKGCNEIGNIADIVMFIYRDEYYNYADCDNFTNNNAEIIVAKSTFGTSFTENLLFKKSVPKFYEPKKIELEF